MTEATTDAEILRDLAAAGLKPIEINGTPCVLIPEGYSFEELGHLRERPQRIEITQTLGTLDSLLAYCHAHADARSTVAFVRTDWQRPSIGVTFDHHEGRLAGHCKHAATYAFPKSVELDKWMLANGKKMSQAEFAEFIEDNLPDIVEPAGADMLTIARTLKAKKDVTFESSVNPGNGAVQLRYEETIKGQAQKGNMEIPETFKIALIPYVGGNGYILTARLRWRIPDRGEGLTLWYDLHRPHKTFEEAIAATIEAFREEFAYPVYLIP